MKKVWLSLYSDKIFYSETEAFRSDEDFIEGLQCKKCGMTTTTLYECNCK